jgi:hypothetical protein
MAQDVLTPEHGYSLLCNRGEPRRRQGGDGQRPDKRGVAESLFGGLP